MEGARTRLKVSRERDPDPLCASQVREAAQAAQVQLVSHCEL
jgi:hypothetical protein